MDACATAGGSPDDDFVEDPLENMADTPGLRSHRAQECRSHIWTGLRGRDLKRSLKKKASALMSKKKPSL